MSAAEFVLRPIGVVRSSRTHLDDDHWDDVVATIELDPSFPPDCIDGLETFSHAEIIFVFDRLAPAEVVSGARHPRGNVAWPRVGIFAQRGSVRPNRLGATIVRILGRDGHSVRVQGLDAADATPVLDIKPVMTEFLPRSPVRQPDWSHELMRDYW